MEVRRPDGYDPAHDHVLQYLPREGEYLDTYILTQKDGEQTTEKMSRHQLEEAKKGVKRKSDGKVCSLNCVYMAGRWRVTIAEIIRWWKEMSQ